MHVQDYMWIDQQYPTYINSLIYPKKYVTAKGSVIRQIWQELF